MDSTEKQLLIRYHHRDCAVDPSVEWHDLWSCACNGVCPACGTKDIEPIDWIDAASCSTPAGVTEKQWSSSDPAK
jgi:hypothetical protein